MSVRGRSEGNCATRDRVELAFPPYKASRAHRAKAPCKPLPNFGLGDPIRPPIYMVGGSNATPWSHMYLCIFGIAPSPQIEATGGTFETTKRRRSS